MPSASRHEPEDGPEAPLEEDAPRGAPTWQASAAGGAEGAAPPRAASVNTSAPIAPICPPRLPSTPVVVPEVATMTRVTPSVSGVAVSSHPALSSAAASVVSLEFKTFVADASSERIACQPPVVPSEVSEPAAAIARLQAHSCTIPKAVLASAAKEASLQHLVIDLGYLDKLVTRLEESAAWFGPAPLSTTMIDVQARERCGVSDYVIDLNALEDLVQRLERSSECLVAGTGS